MPILRSRVLVLAIASAGCSGGPSADAGRASDAGLTVQDAPSPDAVAPDAPGTPDARPPAGDAGAATEVAYVSTYLSGLAALRIDPASGALTGVSGSPYDAQAGLYAVALDPSGRFVYAVDFRRSEIVGFRTATDGTLTPLPHSPLATPTGPVAIAVAPDGRFVYVGTGDPEASIAVYIVSPDDGSLAPTATPPIGLGTSAAYIAPHPTRPLVYVQAPDGIHAYALDGATGALHERDGSPFATTIHGGGLVFHPGGKLLFNGQGLNVLAVDADTGALAAVAGSPFTTDVGSDPHATDVAVSPDGRFVYAVRTQNGHLWVFAVDADSGKLIAVDGSPFDASPFPYSVAVDPANRFVLVGNDDVDQLSVFSIDPQSGAPTPVANSPFTVPGLQPQFAIRGL